MTPDPDGPRAVATLASRPGAETGRQQDAPNTCRAAVFYGDGTVRIRRFPMPALPPSGAILKVEAVGMCGSDVGQFHGVDNTGRGRYPVIAGHEIVGRIFQISPEAAAAWKVGCGDRVAVDEIVHTAQGRLIYGKDFTADPDAGAGLFGGFGEFLVLLPETRVYEITDERSAAELTIVEGLANAVGWTRHVGPGDTVVIQGPGHIGLACVCAAREAGAAAIIVTGTAADGLRLETALKVGASHVIDVDRADPVAEVARLTDGALADVVIDATSNSTTSLGWALRMARVGGDIVVGGLNKFTPLRDFVSDWIPLRRLTIHPGGQLDFQTAVDLVNARRIPTADLLGATFALDDIADALSLLARTVPGRDAVRVSVTLGNDLSRHGS